MINESDRKWVLEVSEKIIKKMDKISDRSKYKIPYTTINGVHDDKSANLNNDDISWWTNGFWGGMMNLMYHETSQDKYREYAKIAEEKLDRCFEDFYGLNHDVGFMYIPTSVASYMLTKNPKSRKRALHAATILAGRYNVSGEFLRAWNDSATEDTRGYVIIDSMLNIPLLYFATEETKDPRFKQIAMKHADTVKRTFIRKDGSVNHIVEFNPYTGEVVKSHGGQGYSTGSSWTRGQSWGIYGFLMSYKHTEKEEYLEAAMRIADYYISNILENNIIPVDFKQPKEPKWEDSTSAAIASCGLIEISKYACKQKRNIYMDAAVRLLKTLDKSRCDYTTNCDCILKNCSAAYHRKDHNFNIIYGDYFFMEAIFKLKGNDLYIW